MSDDYNAIRTAVKVAESGSFVRASELLHVPTSTVSARVQALERSLGVKLFQRSTRRVRLTEAGQRFLEHARGGCEAFEDAISAATEMAQQPRGLLRIAAPALFANHILPQLLPRFVAKYPDLKMVVTAVNRLPDLVEKGFDVGIGVGPARWASYTRRSLFAFLQGIYASPRLLGRHGHLTKVDELGQLPWLSSQTDSATVTCVLHNGSRSQTIKLVPHVSVSDVSALHGLTAAGLGAALLPEQLCEEDVAAGRLVRVLPGWRTEPVPVSAYYSRRQLEPERVKVFLDYLIEWFTKSVSAQVTSLP